MEYVIVVSLLVGFIPLFVFFWKGALFLFPRRQTATKQGKNTEEKNTAPIKVEKKKKDDVRNETQCDTTPQDKSLGNNTDVSFNRDETPITSSRGSTGQTLSLQGEEDLPMCPLDLKCHLINNRDHYMAMKHTCRLFPCYHGHLEYHSKFFIHSEGQIVKPKRFCHNPYGTVPVEQKKKNSLFATRFGPNVPNASLCVLHHRGAAYPIYADWETLRLHTLRRYIFSITEIPPANQKLVVQHSSALLVEELASLQSMGVTCGTDLRLEENTAVVADE